MEDGIGTIFYIIISIIIIAVSALGRKKKPQGKQVPGTGVNPLEELAREFKIFEEASPKGEDDYFADYPVDEEIKNRVEEPAQPGPVITPSVTQEILNVVEPEGASSSAHKEQTLYGGEADMPSPQDHLIFKGESHDAEFIESESIIRKEYEDFFKKSEIRSEEEQQLIDKEKEEKEMFDLRKAVIYAEILNRKYE